MSEAVLYVVATPIGNLGDMTPRAIEVLKQVEVIAAEDTRHSRRLLNHFGIGTPLLSCHEHNERQQAEKLLARLQQGDSVALISDAGTPLISDPGYFLVRTVREAGVKVVPVPGASAIIAALSVSGLATDRFFFEGFLPSKSSGRKKRLAELADFSCTWACYESTHRISDSLKDFAEVLGGSRYIVLAREMTKTFETVLAGTISEVMPVWKTTPINAKGNSYCLLRGKGKRRGSSSIKQPGSCWRVCYKSCPLKKRRQWWPIYPGIVKKSCTIWH